VHYIAHGVTVANNQTRG